MLVCWPMTEPQLWVALPRVLESFLQTYMCKAREDYDADESGCQVLTLNPKLLNVLQLGCCGAAAPNP